MFTLGVKLWETLQQPSMRKHVTDWAHVYRKVVLQVGKGKARNPKIKDEFLRFVLSCEDVYDIVQDVEDVVWRCWM